MISKKILDSLAEALSKIPTQWEGRKAISEMKDFGYPHWKQMEWIGFYFQFLCDTTLRSIMEIPGPKYNHVEFDGFLKIPWDFKAHPEKNAKGKENNNVIVNDRIATRKAIKEFGGAGLILALGEAIYNDQDRSFQVWHQELKGGLSSYEKERIVRKAPSRLRKVAFTLKEIDLILLDETLIKKLSSFQEGSRNSDGSARNAKILLDIHKIKPAKVIHF